MSDRHLQGLVLLALIVVAVVASVAWALRRRRLARSRGLRVDISR
ncbi:MULTISPECIES: hypothetical protein [Sphingomonas]|nr:MULTISPECIES: hypothetical protein [Sphingomonas]